MENGSVCEIGWWDTLLVVGAGTLTLWLTACGVGPYDAGGPVAGRDTMPGKVETASRRAVPPPVDQDVPVVLETATFAMG